jgi:hypothetical protein
MATTPEDILDELSTIIMDLGAIREQVTDSVDRSAINNQIKALTKWWRKIDDERAGESNKEIDNSKKTLVAIAKDLKAEKKNLKEVAVVIHRAAQTIAIAEKVAKLVT